MKRIALLLVFSILFSFSVAFADIIAPQPSGNEVVNTQEESGEPTVVIEDSGDIAEAPVVEENTQDEESGKTSNPLGGIIAIIVVIVMVALVALVSKK